MEIAVVGAGGVGGYYGAVLSRAGHGVSLLARGDHLRAIESDGLTVVEPGGESFTASVRASDRAADLAPPDLVLVAVKAYSLGAVSPAVKELAGRGGVVLPLLNGVDILDRLVARGIPESAVLAGLTYISAARVAPGRIERRSNFRRVVLGEPHGGSSERARRMAAPFEDAAVEVQVAEDIQLELWRKFAFIAPLAAICGLARAPIGAVRGAPLGEDLVRRAVGEVVAVAAARGSTLPTSVEAEVVERILGLDAGLRPSFLLDVLEGSETELDILSGTVARLGREAGVPTPIHDATVTALTASLGGAS